jgi:hypothetical protein
MPSSAYASAIHSEFPGITPLQLVTITAGATTLRLCTDMQDLVSRGNTFTACGDLLDGQLYDDREDRPPRARIVFQNLSGALLAALRSLDPRETTYVMVELVTAEEPDTVQASWSGAELREISYNSLTLEGEITADNVVGIAAPSASYGPNGFPALHAGVP